MVVLPTLSASRIPRHEGLVEYFAVCGLGLDGPPLQQQGPFHALTPEATGRCMRPSASWAPTLSTQRMEEPEDRGRKHSHAIRESQSDNFLHSKKPSSSEVPISSSAESWGLFWGSSSDSSAAADGSSTEASSDATQNGPAEASEPAGPVKAVLLDRYPAEDNNGSPLPEMLPCTVLPDGVRVYSRGSDPDDPESMPRSYSVILTDTSGNKMYVAALLWRDRVDPLVGKAHGLPPRSYADKCMCIVSRLPYLSQFQQMLGDIHRLCFQPQGCPHPVWETVASLVSIPAPKPTHISVVSFEQRVHMIRPPNPEAHRPPHVSYRVLIDSLKVEAIIQLFTAMLLERKILLLSSNLQLLTLAAEALVSLMYPLQWLSVYVPVLPVSAFECLEAPVQFLYGVCTAQLQLNLEEIQDVVVADLDQHVVYASGGKQPGVSEGVEGEPVGNTDASPSRCSLPRKVAKRLETALTSLTRPSGIPRRMTLAHAPPGDHVMVERHYGKLSEKPWGAQHEDAFQLAFTCCFASLLEGYRPYVKNEGSGDAAPLPDPFDGSLLSEKFLEYKRETMGDRAADFVEKMLETYAVQVFLAEHAAAGTEEGSFLDQVMSVLGTEEEVLVAFPVQPLPKQKTFLTPLLPRESSSDGVALRHDQFPESPASVLHKARAKAHASSLMQRADTVGMQELAEALAQLSAELQALRRDPVGQGEEVRNLLSAIMEKGVATGSKLVECIVPCLRELSSSDAPSTESVPGQGAVGSLVSSAELEALAEVVGSVINYAARRREYAPAAALLEAALDLHSVDSGAVTHLPSHLRHLDIWHKSDFWKALYFLRRRHSSEAEQAQDPDWFALQSLMQVTSMMGIPEDDAGAMLDALAAKLPLVLQVSLREKMLQRQRAKAFLSMLGHSRRGIGEGLQPSRTKARWSAVKDRVMQEKFATFAG